MGQILRNWRILSAAAFSLVLVVGAYMLAQGTIAPSKAEASTESALLQTIATRDSDGDGLFDWEEALYGTSPSTADSFKLGMTDGEAVSRGLIVPKAIADITIATSSPTANSLDPSLPPAPAAGTLTAVFAQNLLSLYLSAKQVNGGADLSADDMQKLATQALASLSSALVTAPDFKSASDLKVAGSGPDTLKDFAGRAEAVLLTNTSNATTSEINYLKSALMDNDVTALPHLVSIAKAYRDSAVGLVALNVPQELVADDLKLVNALMRVSEITSDFARVNEDPLAAMLALQQYAAAVFALGDAFTNIGKTYARAGVSLAPGTPGAAFVNLASEVTQSQQAATKKP